MKKTIVLVGTLDTKGEEYAYVRDKILELGCQVIVVDAGVLGVPPFQPDITREQVARAAGMKMEDILTLGEGEAIQTMARGATQIADELYRSGKLDGILSLGGSMGTSLATAIMRTLPVGVPKVMFSTVATLNTPAYVGTKDIAMIHSVADVVGLNRMTRRMLATAAGAVVGMVQADPGLAKSEKPLIGITLHGDLMPCARQVKKLLEDKGYEVIFFAATGPGGRAFEEWIGNGLIDGVFDLTAHEMVDNVFGGLEDAGPSRLEAAGRMRLPQLVAPGKTDMFTYKASEEPPERWRGRKNFLHNPEIRCIRTTGEEMAQVAKIMAEKLNKATGPTAVIVPLKGVAGRDREGDDWYDPQGILSFTDSLKRTLRPGIELIAVDAHINDELFGETAASLLHELMLKQSTR